MCMWAWHAPSLFLPVAISSPTVFPWYCKVVLTPCSVERWPLFRGGGSGLMPLVGSLLAPPEVSVMFSRVLAATVASCWL